MLQGCKTFAIFAQHSGVISVIVGQGLTPGVGKRGVGGEELGMEHLGADVVVPRGGADGLRAACFHMVTLVAGSNRTARGILEEISLLDCRIQTSLKGKPGDVLVLTAVFDTSAVNLACKVVEVRSDELLMRIVALTPESQAAVTRFILTKLRGDVRKGTAYLQPKFKSLPGQSRRVHKPWTADLRETDRHRSASERWLRQV
jgi:hypothetical protein